MDPRRVKCEVFDVLVCCVWRWVRCHPETASTIKRIKYSLLCSNVVFC